ncbi:MAG TPA: AAA family ATPase [Pseudonocardiaceae bacterium]|nr:AAA family ATPase [Pseudonocardiaceae bacterium]
MLTTLAVENYRSLRSLVLPLHQLTLITGANGSGKSSIYRSLRLLADAARNGAVAALAREGGLASTLWAGPEKVGRPGGGGRTKPVALRLGFAGEEFGYAVDFGLPSTNLGSKFSLDPIIRRESVWSGPLLRPAALMADRMAAGVRVRDETGAWSSEIGRINSTDSMLSMYADPRRSPELLLTRERIRSWRFYDQFRTDANAPARSSRIGTRTPVLDHEGADLAAALQTIREFGDADALDTAIDQAFPGSQIHIAERDGWFELKFRQHGLLRPLGASELSDGTLRYLLWVAALLAFRPPELFVLNEPETSLHPDLLPALAALISTTARKTQVIVVSHADPLIRSLTATAEELGEDVDTVELVKESGATVISGQGRLDQPAWHWPTR